MVSTMQAGGNRLSGKTDGVFDYAQLSPADAPFIQERAAKIKKRLGKLSAADVLALGVDLLAVRERIPHGLFLAWVRSEFDWAVRTVQQIANVGERFQGAKIAHLNFSASALYSLSASSVPASAITEAMERAEAGETITHTIAKDICQSHKPTKEAAFHPDSVLENTRKAVESVYQETPPEHREWFADFVSRLGKELTERAKHDC